MMDMNEIITTWLKTINWTTKTISIYWPNMEIMQLHNLIVDKSTDFVLLYFSILSYPRLINK